MKLFFYTITIILILLFLGITSCKVNAKKKQEKKPNSLITFKKVKGRCMRCPNFSIEILDNRTAIYEGKENVSVLGKLTIPLSKKQFKTLINEFEYSNFTNFEPLYLTRRRDSPRWILIYNGYKVNTQEKACPKPLMKLMQLIESIKPV